MDRRPTLDNRRVTVVLPTYNRAGLLPRAIETALRQTAAAACDIVLVDDGSTDATPRVAARYGERLIYIRQRNGGLPVARNTAVRARPNEFVAFLDDDDLWEPDKIERQLAAFAAWPQAVLVAGRTIDRYPDGRCAAHRIPPLPLDQPADLAPCLFETNFLPPSSVMVRTRTLLAVGLFQPRMRRAQDSHLWVRIACRGPCVYLSAPVATYSVGVPGALSRDTFSQLSYQLRGRYLLQRELRRRPDCRPSWRRGLARSFTDLRDVAYRQGRYAAAARYGLRSLLHRPWGRPAWEWGRFLDSLYRVWRRA
jgi:GT2 family glycosyltransferase